MFHGSGTRAEKQADKLIVSVHMVCDPAFTHVIDYSLDLTV